MTACGEEVISALQAANQVQIDGVTPSNRALINLSVIDPSGEPINACGGTATVSSDVTFISPTDGTDTILIALPLGTNYIPGSSLFAISTYVSNAEPIISFVNGIQELKWAVVPNIPAFTPIDFLFDVVTDPAQATCRYTEQPILVRTLSPVTVLCRGDECNVSLASGSKEESVVFDQFQVEFSDVEINARCGAEELIIENITVSNTGTQAINTNTDLNIYFDSDGDDEIDLTAGDILLGTLSSSDPIPVGGSINLSGTFTIDPSQSCPLIIDYDGCSCTDPLPIEEVNYLNAGIDTTICNNGMINLGCGEDVAAFDYFWAGLNGAPVSALSDRRIANPLFSYNKPLSMRK